MVTICNYCNKEKETENFEHPVTLQVEPICIDCKNKFVKIPSYETERRLLSKSGCLAPVLLVISIIFLISGNNTLGTWGITVSVIIGAFSLLGVEYYVKKRDRNFGFDPSKFVWCKTCKNFRKVKGWNSILFQSKELIDDTEIPCKIFNQTKSVWVNYFNLSPDDRKLYPDGCKNWLKK